MNRPAELDAAPIMESTKKGYLKAVRAAHRYSQAKRTTDWEEPPIIKMVEVVQDLIQREDLTRETRLVPRSALLWFIKSDKVATEQASLQATAMLESLRAPIPS